MSAEQQDIPSGQVQNDDYVMRQGQKGGPIPVQSDNAVVESGVDSNTADSEAQLEKDDKEAIDQSNIIDGGRTRGAKPDGSYQEPGDEEGLPGPDDGTSAVAQ